MVKRGADGPAKVAAQCEAVAEALRHAEHLPKDVRNMLADSVEDTVGVLKSKRHAFQAKFATMIGEALTGAEAAIAKEVTDVEAKIAAAEGEKAARAAAHEAATNALGTKYETCKAAKTAKTESQEALKEAKAALHTAEATQKSGDASLEAASTKKARLEAFQKDSLTPSKDEGGHKCDKALKAIGAEYNMDSTMINALPGALAKEPANRGTFDTLVIKSMDDALTLHLHQLNTELETGEQSKKDRAQAVETAKAALTAAEAKLEACSTAQTEAVDAEKEAQAALKTSAKAVESFEKEMKATTKACEAAKKRLELFKDEAAKGFAELEAATLQTPGRFFETIEGVEVDSAIVNIFRNHGEGYRVTLDDATQCYDKVAASGDISQVERWTLRYCLSEFSWYDAAHDYIIDELKKLPQANPEEPDAKKRKTKGYYKSVDGVKCDSGVIEAANKAVAGRGDGRVSEQDAQAVWAQMMDGGKVTQVERWSLRYCLTEYKWTQPACDWISAELKKVVQK